MAESKGQLDPTYLNEMAEGDTEFISELLDTFVETAADLVEAIEAAAAEQAAEKGIYAAHTLKGSSRSIGAVPLGDLCQVLEEAARCGDMDSFALMARNIPETFAQLKREIETMMRQAA